MNLLRARASAKPIRITLLEEEKKELKEFLEKELSEASLNEFE
jgi:hypothetical protein